MGNNQVPVLYWDSSAILSALFEDDHSEEAGNQLRRQGIHLVSSLVNAEIYAVIFRLQREKMLADVLVASAFETFEKGPWRQIHIHPDRLILKSTALKRYLRGPDLWHLCAVLILREQLPEIQLLTYDQRLQKAAKAENLQIS